MNSEKLKLVDIDEETDACCNAEVFGVSWK